MDTCKKVLIGKTGKVQIGKIESVGATIKGCPVYLKKHQEYVNDLTIKMDTLTMVTPTKSNIDYYSSIIVL